MKAFCVKISSWTSSFRYPNLISGYQPTLEVPPVSTVLGLINAAAGRYLEHKNFLLGYKFEYKHKATDLETIYQIEAHDKNYPKNQVKSNVIPREFLHDCKLTLYIKDGQVAGYFRNPHYQLLLGRSGDLATVESVTSIELEKTDTAKIGGQIVPFEGYFLAGQIQALPLYFTNSIPRKNIGTQPFTVISHEHAVSADIEAYRIVDSNSEEGIYFHTINV